MRRILSCVLIALLFLLTPSLPVQAETSAYVFTLSEAKELALQNSPKITNRLVNDELVRVNERDAWIAYEQAKANYQNTGGKIDAYKNAMDAAKKAYDAAVYAREDGRISLDILKKQIEYETESQYFSHINMINTVKIMEESYKMQANLSKIESVKLNLGMSTQFAVDAQRQKTMEMERQLTSLYNTQNTLKWEFNRSLGRLPEEPLELAPVTFEAVQHENQQAGEAKAKEASLAIDQYNRSVKDKNNEVQDYLDNASDKVERIKLEIKQIKLFQENTEYGIELSMKALHENLYLAQKALVDSRATFDMAKKNFEAQELQYDLGVISKLIFDAEKAAYLQKQADYEKAVYDYYLATRQVGLAEIGIFLN